MQTGRFGKLHERDTATVKRCLDGVAVHSWSAEDGGRREIRAHDGHRKGNEMDDLTIAAATARASELVLRELVVALVEAGALDRSEAVKAYLRAEVTAGVPGEASGQAEAMACAGLVRLMQQEIEGRLRAKPEFQTLRQARRHWLEAPQGRPDPWGPGRGSR